MAQVLLVNSNRMKPPVAPVGLDYIAGALSAAGHQVDLLDLCFADDPAAACAEYFARSAPDFTAISFRNSDDCFWPSAHSFVPELAELVSAIRGVSSIPLVLGGSGFSIFPRAILSATGVDIGVRGSGELPLTEMARRFDSGEDYADIPGVVVQEPAGRGFRVNPVERFDGGLVLATSRDFLDNGRYFREGGQAGVETKRGCPAKCSYCADPVVKGCALKLRTPDEVAEEFAALLARGINVFHTCDHEFNIPYDHAVRVCDALIERGLGPTIQWYAYAAAAPFDGELALRMKRAGCVGINFGADSLNDSMLHAYGRGYCANDVRRAIRICRGLGIRVMVDLLLGGPGETRKTLRETIDALKAESPDCVGAALGVRVYPGTRFATALLAQGPPRGTRSLLWKHHPQEYLNAIDCDDPEFALLGPVFYVDNALGEEPARYVRELIGGDQRFFVPSNEEDLKNYNYNDNQRLVDAIARGARGAYWDMLRPRA